MNSSLYFFQKKFFEKEVSHFSSSWIRLHAKHYVCFVRKRHDEHVRLRFLMKKKMGSAVKRNLYKRWVKHCCRTLYPSKFLGSDLIVIQKKTHDFVFQDAWREWAFFARRLASLLVRDSS